MDRIWIIRCNIELQPFKCLFIIAYLQNIFHEILKHSSYKVPKTYFNCILKRRATTSLASPCDWYFITTIKSCTCGDITGKSTCGDTLTLMLMRSQDVLRFFRMRMFSFFRCGTIYCTPRLYQFYSYGSMVGQLIDHVNSLDVIWSYYLMCHSSSSMFVVHNCKLEPYCV